MRKCVDTHIKTIVTLTSGKLIGFYFLYLFYVFYYSVMMQLRSGKKVSILSSCDVNHRPVLSRRSLFEDSSYRVVGAMCMSCDCP
jgi:hypothetical protein